MLLGNCPPTSAATFFRPRACRCGPSWEHNCAAGEFDRRGRLPGARDCTQPQYDVVTALWHSTRRHPRHARDHDRQAGSCGLRPLNREHQLASHPSGHCRVVVATGGADHRLDDQRVADARNNWVRVWRYRSGRQSQYRWETGNGPSDFATAASECDTEEQGDPCSSRHAFTDWKKETETSHASITPALGYRSPVAGSPAMLVANARTLLQRPAHFLGLRPAPAKSARRSEEKAEIIEPTPIMDLVDPHAGIEQADEERDGTNEAMPESCPKSRRPRAWKLVLRMQVSLPHCFQRVSHEACTSAITTEL